MQPDQSHCLSTMPYYLKLNDVAQMCLLQNFLMVTVLPSLISIYFILILFFINLLGSKQCKP